jgi:hypothetical protein
MYVALLIDHLNTQFEVAPTRPEFLWKKPKGSFSCCIFISGTTSFPCVDITFRAKKLKIASFSKFEKKSLNATRSSSVIPGVSNSNLCEGHIPKEKCFAGRMQFIRKKALLGHNLQEKLSK